jgi:2-polyprenyl-6-methoxyphenol hydroxylase-like FAD-dependent oxidoreductase
MAAPEFDVAIVGASAAGCTAAILYGRAGASVALVERQPSIDAYKTVCTHYLQRSAVPTLERLGLVRRIEQAGGQPNHTDIWTRWGWATPP